MGAFREGRSDVDFVALVKRELARADLIRLGAVHAGRWASALVRDVGLRRRWPLVANGIYLRPGDLAKSPLGVTPLAGHVSGRFRIAERKGLDVNPVTWHVLAQHGITVRGPAPAQLQIRTDPAELRAWTLANLNSYWWRWAQRAQRAGPNRATMLGRRYTSAGVLGAPRLHYTIATGEIATKEAAVAYALDVVRAAVATVDRGCARVLARGTRRASLPGVVRAPTAGRGRVCVTRDRLRERAAVRRLASERPRHDFTPYKSATEIV